VVVREVPVPPVCMNAIHAAHSLYGHRPEQRLWGWSRSRAWQLVKAVMKTAGIGPAFTPHRRGFATASVFTPCEAAFRSTSYSGGWVTRA
jgi:hypothetical protein